MTVQPPLRMRLLLTAKVFYGKAVLNSDLAELQQTSPPATKAGLKAQQRLQKKERQRAKQVEEEQKASKKAKKEAKLQSMEAKSMRVKAESMMKIADGQNLKTYFDIAKVVMSPETLKAQVGPHLTSFSKNVLNFQSSVAALESSDSEVEIVINKAPKTPTSNNATPKTPSTGNDDDSSSDED